MPTGTKVDRQYQAIKQSLMDSGKSKGRAESEAAATAQKRTGLSLKTGKPPKGHR
jgi:hypothetical protein